MDMKDYAPKELENSKRIFKSATPKYTLDWYVKWVASAFILSAMAVRGNAEFIFVDLGLSTVGVFLWLIVSIIWNDRALIMLNGIGLIFLIKNLVENIV